ncbi:TraU family protein, partial [Pseudoalteromonas sp. SR45-4]|uniref:TraU family protein n=1 Tax=Pseudoalteromonas sp. SR45-4 TaxID=2760929 RepID=UPI0015FC9D2A
DGNRPKAEADGNRPKAEADGNRPKAEADGNNGQCCHPLGDFWMNWGKGRKSPGGGKDNSFVYSIFKYNDCCVRLF